MPPLLFYAINGGIKMLKDLFLLLMGGTFGILLMCVLIVGGRYDK